VTTSRGKKRPSVESPTGSFIRNVLEGYNGAGNGLTKKQKLILDSANIAGRTFKFVLSPIVKPVKSHFEAVAAAQRIKRRQKLNMLLILLGIGAFIVFLIAVDLKIL
jgi:hypothetical protein